MRKTCKKTGLLALTLALTVASLTGCGSSKTKVTTYDLPTEAEEAGVYVQPIEGLSEDFIRGVDISSLLVEEASGVVYYNEDGEEQDLIQTLAQYGVNYVRVRVWNDPYDSEGNGYGGGNCTASTAAEIGSRAAAYGMQICVDFHYSDFWADPNKQYCPKAWEDMTIDEKCEALYTYTRESLEEILDAGAEVGIVQIGNEINSGLCGETDWTKKRQLLQAATKAIREIEEERDTEILIAVHFTDVSDADSMLENAQKLEDKGIDYDIFAVSYYSYWHGSLNNLSSVLTTIADTYGVQTMVAETAYPYTTEDGDEFANSESGEGIEDDYTTSVQGQTNAIRDVFATASEAGAIGVFYWEPAWIPVGSSYDSNLEIWETYGSGWASSYAVEYDPKDAGVYYGGCSWDNQALFDFDGYPLESLKVFKYLYVGTIVEQTVEVIADTTVNISLGSASVDMPETVSVTLNDRSVLEVPVIWDTTTVAKIDPDVAGSFVVNGTFDLSALTVEINDDITSTLSAAGNQPVASVNVNRFNLMSNYSFEEEDTSAWKISNTNITDFQNKSSDAYSGDIALHYYSTDAISFTVEQTFTDLEPGVYEFGMYIQGGSAGDDAKMYIYARTSEETLTEDTSVSSWCNWENPDIDGIVVGEDGTLTVGASISCAAYGWGTLDDFYLYKIE